MCDVRQLILQEASFVVTQLVSYRAVLAPEIQGATTLSAKILLAMSRLAETCHQSDFRQER